MPTPCFSVVKPKITCVSQLPVSQLIYFLIIAGSLFYLYSDNYTNKLCNFRHGPQKIGDPVSVFVAPGKISLRRPGYSKLRVQEQGHI